VEVGLSGPASLFLVMFASGCNRDAIDFNDKSVAGNHWFASRLGKYRKELRRSRAKKSGKILGPCGKLKF